MTTAAPPEKMTNGKLAEHLNNMARLNPWLPEYGNSVLREAARRLAPTVGDADETAFLNSLDDTLTLGNVGLAKIMIEQHRAALSAPPAASAEGEELERMAWALIQADDCEGNAEHSLPESDQRKYWAKRAENFRALAAGYRKRAAQGVGEFAAELVKWCDEKEHRLNQLAGSRLYTETPELAARADQMREVAAHIRRLSALPKGQEHEG